MHDVTKLQAAIAIIAAGAAIISFVIYLLVITNKVTPAAHEKLKENSDEAIAKAKSLTAPSPAEVASLVQSLASLSEALAKAGPALWSLIASVLFLLVACLAAGTMSGSSAPVTNPTAPGGTGSTSAAAPSTGNLPPEHNLDPSTFKK